MANPAERPKYVYVKRSKGHAYLYFDTGQRRKSGARILTRLPPMNHRTFERELEKARLQRWRRETDTIPSMAIRPPRVDEFHPSMLDVPSVGDDLYFIRAGDAVKIGHAADVWQRMANMQANNPVELNCICRLPGRGHEERAWHAYFRAHHIRGEWYQWTPALDEAIRLARKGAQWWS